jgi:predicted acylesterase/phospholipase RssA
MVAEMFNDGALDSASGDAQHDRSAFAKETVVRALREELGEAYFGQGSGPDVHHRVSTWMRMGAADAQFLLGAAREMARDPNRGHLAAQLRAEDWSAGDTPLADACTAGPGGEPQRDDEVVGVLADRARFVASVDRAAAVVAELLRRRFVSEAAAQAGIVTAFLETADYLDDRTWRRSLRRPVVGVVAKGGAVTGLYAAGVVWVALRIIEGCAADPSCHAAHPELVPQLLSGTSTGAFIATAIDYFATGAQPLRADLASNPLSTEPAACTSTIGRVDELGGSDRFAAWFTCNAIQDLYCVRDGSLFDLARGQGGVVEFQGIQAQMRHQLRGCATLRNGSELILSTVDFRTGRLYAMSDLDRCGMRSAEDVVQGATASAVLPVIAKPVEHLPVDYDPSVSFTYLDGGIRAELPVLPLAHRGAERVLVISSSGPMVGETDRLRNAVAVAPRYIGIETDTAAEVELDRAQQHAESVRGAEMDICLDMVARSGRCASGGCSAVDLCAGRWKHACKASAPGEYAAHGAGSIRALWRTTSLFRDEERVPGSPGYKFDPAQQRSLFMAGAEAARVRCVEIATTLGMDELENGGATELRPKVVAWCASPMPPVELLCGTRSRGEPKLENCPAPGKECSHPTLPQTLKCRPECVR